MKRFAVPLSLPVRHVYSKYLVALCSLPLLLPSVHAKTLAGKVVGVTDGDTITVLVEQHPVKVRLHGIDSPESHQAYGTQAKKFTSKMAFDKMAKVIVHDRDQYGRTVGEIILPDGNNLNASITRHGFAWAYVQYSKKFVAQEQEAKKFKRGLWADSNPTPPWEFRRGGSRTSPTPSVRGRSSASAPTVKTPTRARAPSPVPDESPRVWVNTDSGVYHYPHCRWYGNTNYGSYMSEKQAVASGNRRCMRE